MSAAVEVAEVASAVAIRAAVARHVAGQRRSCGGCKGRPGLSARRHRAAPAAILSSERADAASSSRHAEIAGAQPSTTQTGKGSSKLSNNIVPFSSNSGSKQIGDDEYVSEDDEPMCAIGDGGCGGIRGGRGGDDGDGNNNSPVVIALKAAFLRFTWLHVAAVHVAIVLSAMALGRLRASSQYYMLVEDSASLPSVSSGRIRCSYCRKSRESDDMWFCAGCLQASYCNRTCQEQHWSQHSSQCSGAHAHAVPS